MAGTSESATPVGVVGVGGSGLLAGAVHLGSDGESICAVLAAGGVDCWGGNTYGELGDDASPTVAGGHPDSDTPVAVAAVGGSGRLAGVTGIGSDGTGYCALFSSGGVDCWGDNLNGELAYSAPGNPPTAYGVPVPATGVDGSGLLGGATDLVSDGDGYCALLASGDVACWGSNSAGQLGHGGGFTDTYLPVWVTVAAV